MGRVNNYLGATHKIDDALTASIFLPTDQLCLTYYNSVSEVNGEPKTL